MKKEEIKLKAEKIFTALYKGGVSPAFRFPQGYSANIMNKFADELLKREKGMVSLGILVDYCIHQAHLWRDPNKAHRFTINWAFGPKAMNRFYDTKSGVKYYQDLWLKQHDWDRDGLKFQYTDFKEHPLRKFIYILSEDSTKFKLLNKDSGFALCRMLTTLYTPQSPACKECKFKKECMELLKRSNTELYRLRNEK